MKNFQMLLMGSIIAVFFAACNPATKEDSGERYTLVSDLVLKASVINSDADSSDYAKLDKLYNASELASLYMSEMNLYSNCCCPCDAQLFAYNSSFVKKPVEKVDSTNCPCPNVYEMQISSLDVWNAQVLIDTIEFEKDRQSKGDLIIFKLNNKNKIADGNHVLRIKGNFTGDGEREYKMPIVIKDKKPYLKRY